jgi:hypothetical protein
LTFSGLYKLNGAIASIMKAGVTRSYDCDAVPSYCRRANRYDEVAKSKEGCHLSGYLGIAGRVGGDFLSTSEVVQNIS